MEQFRDLVETLKGDCVRWRREIKQGGAVLTFCSEFSGTSVRLQIPEHGFDQAYQFDADHFYDYLSKLDRVV